MTAAVIFYFKGTMTVTVIIKVQVTVSNKSINTVTVIRFIRKDILE